MKTGNGSGVVKQDKTLQEWLTAIFQSLPLPMRENLLAIFLCLILILLTITTTDNAAQWIYQAF